MIDGEAVLVARCHGKTPRAIARELKCSVDEVNAVLDALGEEITPQFKVRTVAVDLERLSAMESVWFEKCLAGDYNASLLCLKIVERRASLLGLDQPLSRGFDVIELRAAASPYLPSGVDKVMDALNRLALSNGKDVNAPPS
jgi:hypothetical protein